MIKNFNLTGICDDGINYESTQVDDLNFEVQQLIPSRLFEKGRIKFQKNPAEKRFKYSQETFEKCEKLSTRNFIAK